MTARQKSLIGWIGLPGLAVIVGLIIAAAKTRDAAAQAVPRSEFSAESSRVAERFQRQDSTLRRVEANTERIICALEPQSIRCSPRPR